MAIIMNKTKTPEPIIEYVQMKDGPVFSCNEKAGIIFIMASESTWLWKRKQVRMNCKFYYDEDRYNLLFIPSNIRKYDSIDKMISDDEYIDLYNTGILPKRIKHGEQLGIALLIPKIQSHNVKLN